MNSYFGIRSNADANVQVKRSVVFGGGYTHNFTIGAWGEIVEDVAEYLIEELRSKIKKAKGN